MKDNNKKIVKQLWDETVGFLKEIAAPFLLEYTIYPEEEFSVYIDGKELSIGLSFFGDMDLKSIHIELLKEMNIKYNCSYETFCLIHEIGHIAIANILGQEKNTTMVLEEKIFFETFFKERYNRKKHSNKFLQELYMKQPLEKMANLWAQEFIKENRDIVKLIDRVFYRNMKEIYEVVDFDLAEC